MVSPTAPLIDVRPKANGLRHFVEDDIPAVAAMYARSFSCDASPSDIRRYFLEVFFRNPWREESLPSLVYEEDAHIAGFLGVVPRCMIANGEPIRVAVSLHFIVEPTSRCRLMGVQLLRQLFRGPQDLTLTDGANDGGRRLWEAMGGSASPLYSLYWTRLLRPARYVMSQIDKGIPGAELLGSLADAAARRILGSRFAIASQGPDEELSCEVFLDHVQALAEKLYLKPSYDAPQLQWILNRAGRRKGNGSFQKFLVRDSGGQILGWYLYYLNPGEISTVLQIAATKWSIGKVLDHLFHHAYRGGALALSGRLDPRFIQEFSDKYCFLHRRGPWTLVHSRRPDLIQAIQQGDACLTPLEGEWCWLSPSEH
jgi:hypothetical protein